MLIEKTVLNDERNVTLTAYLQPVKGEFYYIEKRPGILIIPGGGYETCSEREAEPAAFAFLQSGFQAFVLRYSVGKDAEWPNPLNDYEQAMCLIRQKAEEWHVYPDKIAVAGFSAGGHLAASAAVLAENRPNAAVLGYAVLTEESAHEWLDSAPGLIDKVHSGMCPCFLFSARTDSIVPVRNTIRFTEALEKNGVMFESHIYSYGPHGFSTGTSSVLDPDAAICPRARRWVYDCADWLKEVLGDYTQTGMSAPLYGTSVNGDSEAYLSVNCTVGCLMKNPEAGIVLRRLSDDMKDLLSESCREQLAGRRDLNSVTLRVKLSDMLGFEGIPCDKTARYDRELRSIRNCSYSG